MDSKQMTTGGFAGHILRVDLTERDITSSPIESRLVEKYIGGLGLTVKLAYDSIKPGTEPLSPQNPIVLGAGALVGTNVPAASRIYAVTKLPASQTIGWCGAGGVNFGFHFKNAGFDHLIIEGRADHPVFLKIINDRVEICDAARLWGQSIESTCEILWGEHGPSAGVLAIGQAGEHAVSFSMAFVDRIATLGRGGLGAIMGSKNLKALVVMGYQ
jgi:aldehyde:ferredoxin oxidoreductase